VEIRCGLDERDILEEDEHHELMQFAGEFPNCSLQLIKTEAEIDHAGKVTIAGENFSAIPSMPITM